MSTTTDNSEEFEFEEFLAKVKEDPALAEKIKGMDHEALSKVAEDEGFNQAASQIFKGRWDAGGIMASTCTRTSRTNLTR